MIKSGYLVRWHVDDVACLHVERNHVVGVSYLENMTRATMSPSSKATFSSYDGVHGGDNVILFQHR
jgi:hypothetical protein